MIVRELPEQFGTENLPYRSVLSKQHFLETCIMLDG